MIAKKPFYRMQRFCRFFTGHRSPFSDYRYNWALAIKVGEKEIALLYKITKTLIERDKAIIYWYIEKKQEHIDSLKTLNVYLAYKDDEEKRAAARKDPNQKEKRLARQEAELFFYKQTEQILRNQMMFLSRYDGRTCKKIARDAGQMYLTIETIMEIEKDEVY